VWNASRARHSSCHLKRSVWFSTAAVGGSCRKRLLSRHLLYRCNSTGHSKKKQM
jgi:hypothetical protein